MYYNDGTTPIGSYAEQNREIISCADLPDYVGNNLFNTLGNLLGGVLLGLLIFMGMVRPGLKLMKTPAAPPAPVPVTPQLSAVVDETPERPGLPVPEPEPEATPDRRLEQAKRLALENPVAVANIVKGWVNGEAPA